MRTRIWNQAASGRACGGARLASGDSEGRVVLWDLGTGVACALLDDPLLAATGISKKAEPSKGGAVKGLGWLGSSPALLAIVLASGLLIIWDPRRMPYTLNPFSILQSLLLTLSRHPVLSFNPLAILFIIWDPLRVPPSYNLMTML